MTTKLTREQRAVLKALGKIAKGREDFISEGAKYAPCNRFSTGCELLDVALGGGLPTSGIIEIFGRESSCKTSHAIVLTKKFIEAYPDRGVVFVDLERSIDNSFLEGFGVDPSKITFIYPETAEEAFESIRVIAESGAFGLIVLDSVDAAEIEADTKRKIGEQHQVGGLPKLMGQALRKISKTTRENEVALVMINQIRSSIPAPGAGRGGTTTSGGNALRFYAIVRIELSGWAPSPARPNRFKIKARVRKNKTYPKTPPAEYTFIINKGPDPVSDLVDIAKEVGVIYCRGRAVKWNLEDNTEVISNENGQEGLKALLREDKELFARIKAEVMKAQE